jgi:hypothetical protein
MKDDVIVVSKKKSKLEKRIIKLENVVSTLEKRIEHLALSILRSKGVDTTHIGIDWPDNL